MSIAASVAPVNPEPEIVTEVPAAPLVGEKELTTGRDVELVTLNGPELLPVPAEVVTLIEPLVAPEGTVVSNEESEEMLKLAAMPLNLTPAAPVNPDPATVTAVPLDPLVGEKEETTGAEAVAAVTVNDEGEVAELQFVWIVNCPVPAPAGMMALI